MDRNRREEKGTKRMVNADHGSMGCTWKARGGGGGGVFFLFLFFIKKQTPFTFVSVHCSDFHLGTLLSHSSLTSEPAGE